MNNASNKFLFMSLYYKHILYDDFYDDYNNVNRIDLPQLRKTTEE